MKKLISITALCATLLFVGGCASMSAEECLVSDWHAIGFEDGAAGYTANRIGHHRKACGKHGIAPDFEAYRAGREEGLREFCQPSRGFSLGAAGGRYYGVCSSDQEPHFVDAYRSGQQLYTLRSNVQSATNAIHSREAELDRVRQQIRDTEAALIAPETTVEQRILLLADLKELSEETGRLEAEIVDLVAERQDRQHELASYEQILADSGY